MAEVGNAINLAPNTISQYENGKREPKLEIWQKMADYFGVSVPYLQGLDSDTNQTEVGLDLALAQATTKYGLSDLQAHGLKQELLANLWFQAKWFKRRECRTYDTTDFQ